MIIRILFIFLFLILCGFILYFIYEIFIPAIKSQMLENQDSLFADVELNYVGNMEEPKIPVSDNRAIIKYEKKRDSKDNRLIYNGVKSCKLFSLIYDTPNDLSEVCIGFGDCAKVCPQEAILIESGIAKVTENCCGCGNCINVCPKKIIFLVPQEEIKEQIPEQKHFKFWKSCYKIFAGK